MPKLEVAISISGGQQILPNALTEKLASYLEREYPGSEVRINTVLWTSPVVESSYREWRRQVVSELDRQNRMSPEASMLMLEEDGSPHEAFRRGLSPVEYVGRMIKTRSDVLLERRSVAPRLAK